MKPLAGARGLVVALLARRALAIRVLQTNENGWADLYIRTLNEALHAANHSVLLSGPAQQSPNSATNDVDPRPRIDSCHWDSCPAHGGAEGRNVTRHDLRWVNSFPVTAVRYGIDRYAPEFWGPGFAPDLVVSGPDSGHTVGDDVIRSGTVGAAVHAARVGIPAIAISVGEGRRAPWYMGPEASGMPDRGKVYARLVLKMVAKLVESGLPALPQGVWLNVNIPPARGPCRDISRFRFVFSRIWEGRYAPPDVQTCGSLYLPSERKIRGMRRQCFISVSPGNAADISTCNDERQAAILRKLQGLMSCLP